MSKVASRVALAGGGTAVAAVSYYGNRLKEWGEDRKNQILDFIRSLPVPDFSGFGSIAFPDSVPTQKAHNSTFVNSENPIGPSVLASSGDNHFLLLTKRLIEVRNILKTIDKNDAIKLPSIVVIGSQSSGKSSLLEAIVGHEILPKGNNMVTKRPVEITLVSSPQAQEDYAEFPAQGITKITDFSRIKTIIKDLNDSVSSEECVSDVPIDLRIYSPNVPDLTLIDLPGYIAINTRDQPAVLKQKIQNVCRKYIQEPNIILAVCAADVDLANSEALNESRAVDPFGYRTVGVLTKVDLVEPQRLQGLLTNKAYNLYLGYYGVVCKNVNSSSKDYEKYQKITTNEEKFFREHAEVFSPIANRLGINNLRTSLMRILEHHLSKSMGSIVSAVRQELDETRYQFKVQFNDQFLSPETYTTRVLDQVKNNLKDLSLEFSRPLLREKIQQLMDSRVLQVCDEIVWMKTETPGMQPNEADITLAQSLLTKSGLGRVATQHVVELLSESFDGILEKDFIKCHKGAVKMMKDLSNEILKSRIYVTSDQVENAIKPFKYEIEFTDMEWNSAQKHALKILQEEYKNLDMKIEELKRRVGWKKLRTSMQYLQNMKPEREIDETAKRHNQQQQQVQVQFTEQVLEQAREAMEIKKQMLRIQSRINHLQPFSMWNNWYPACSVEKFRKLPDECLKSCPEPYLFIISEKLARTAVMFIWIELLNDFFHQLPMEIDNRLYYNLDKQKLDEFVSENENARNHLKLLRKKIALETAMEKLASAQSLNRN